MRDTRKVVSARSARRLREASLSAHNTRGRFPDARSWSVRRVCRAYLDRAFSNFDLCPFKEEVMGSNPIRDPTAWVLIAEVMSERSGNHEAADESRVKRE